MKEASSELSMTAVAVVAIGAVAVIFTTLVLPSLKKNIQRNSLCAQAYKCDDSATSTNDMVTCHYTDDNNEDQTIQCKLEK